MTTTTACNGTRPLKSRPTEPAPQAPVADNLALLLTTRRRRHMHRTAW